MSNRLLQDGVSLRLLQDGSLRLLQDGETSGPATAITLSGPSSGSVGVASSNFTVGANGAITGAVAFTPTSSAGSGTFTPSSVSISAGTPTATFTYTPSTAGARNINGTNDGGLSAPSNVAFTALALTSFNKAITFPLGTSIGAGLAYRVSDIQAGVLTDLTGWITTGLTATPGMSDPPGYSINADIALNGVSSFNGIIEVRNHSVSPVYVRDALNVYGATREATVRFVSLHKFLPGDTISSPTVYVFTNTAGSEASVVAETNTGVVTVSSGDKTYAYDHAVAPAADGALRQFIRWGTTTAGLYDLDTIFVPPITPAVGNVTINAAFTFPSGTSLGTVNWLARDRDGDVGSWGATGLDAVTGMTAGAGQSLGFTLNTTIAPNNSNKTFSGILLVRASAGGPWNAYELNVQSTAIGIVTKVAPFLSTDSFDEAGRRVYDNAAGVVAALEARTTAGIIAIAEITNGYFTDVDLAGDLVLWDQDETVYAQEELIAAGAGALSVALTAASFAMTAQSLTTSFAQSVTLSTASFSMRGQRLILAGIESDNTGGDAPLNRSFTRRARGVSYA